MRCPVCWSAQTLLVLSRTSRGTCEACGATWLWHGGRVSQVKRPLGGKWVSVPSVTRDGVH